MARKKTRTAPTTAIPADLIPTSEAAALKGLAMRTLTQHAKAGHVPGAIHFGGTPGVWMFSKAALLAWTPASRGRPKKQ